MKRFAYLFPGQGAQQAGMGRELYEAFPECRDAFEEADAALEMPLGRTCFDGPQEALALTETTQPAILATSVAALRALEARGLAPCAAAGHSLGEYSAHVAAGTIAFPDALRAVRSRGRFMQEAVAVGRGAMVAVLGLAPQRVDELCREAAGDGVVSPANLNGPAQVVVAGDAEAVERLSAAATAAGARRVVPLAVSAPFHCALMRPAAERLEPLLREIEFADPRFPVWSNVDARPLHEGAAARAALVRQVAAPVRWAETIEGLLAEGIDTFVEVGPGRVLGGLVRGIDRRATTLAVGDPQGLERTLAELGS